MLVTLGISQVAAERRAPDPVPAVPTATVEFVASQTPSVSADGRYVVYAGPPTTADDTRTSTVFLQDRMLDTVVELTAPVEGIRAGNSVWPAISADGCSVAVITEFAYDLFRDDDAGERWDTYKLELPECGGEAGDWELVSTTRGTGFASSAADDVSPLYPPAISGEGATIAYTERFSTSAPELTGITVVDLTVALGDPGRANSVAGTPADAPDSTFRYVGLREPVLSEDGQVLAFTSDADPSTLLGEWGTGPQPGGFATSHVFVWDRSNPDRNTNVRRVSSAPGSLSTDAHGPAMSGDGRFVAFVSSAMDLVPGATLPPCTPDCVPQVYVYDRTDGTVKLGSREPGDPAAPPVGANLGAGQPTLNRTGEELVYVSRATNLFPTRSSGVGGPTDGDIVVSVPATGTVQRVSVLPDGVTPAPAANSHPQVSASGRVVVFDTLAGAAYGSPAGGGRQVAVVEHPPELELADLDVGTVAVGFPGPEWDLVVANKGPSSFVPALVEVDNPDFLISGGTCVDQITVPVPPGGVCTVNLMLLPSVAGKIEGTLRVSEYGFGSVEITSQLSGFGGEPALAPSPGGAESQPLVVGERGEPMSFSVYNVAFAQVKVKSVKIQGSSPDDFLIGKDECTAKRIDASGTCNIEVVFSPTASGRRTASVVVTTIDGSYTTMLVSGTAHYDPKLAVSTTTVIAPARLTVVGAGFAPNSAVTLSWADGQGRPIVVLTDAAGGLLAEMLVRPNDRAGARTVVAQTPGGEFAAADVTVVVRRKASGVGSARWPGA